MFVYMLFYVLLPFNEEVTEFRKLQNVSPALFWFTNYSIDLLIHIVFCAIIYVVLIIADTHNIFEQVDYSECNIFSMNEKNFVMFFLLFQLL